MAYLTPSDFRPTSVTWPCLGITFEIGEVSDANLTGLIAEMSHRFDRYTGDHYEAETAATVTVDGEDNTRLWMPKRIRAVTSISVTYPGGSPSVVSSTTYTFEVFADDFAQIDHESYIDGSSAWPAGVANIAVVGNFSWATTVSEVKRAVALACWERVRPVGDALRYGAEIQVDGSTVMVPVSSPFSRIPEAQELADMFRRKGRA